MMAFMHGSEHAQEIEKASWKQSCVIEEKQNSKTEQPAITRQEKVENTHESKSKPLMFLGVAAMAAMMILMIL